jgi:O-antigen ligase
MGRKSIGMESYRAAPEEAVVLKPKKKVHIFPIFLAAILIVHGLFNFTPVMEAFITISMILAASAFIILFRGEYSRVSEFTDSMSVSVFLWCFLVWISAIWAVEPTGAFFSIIGYGGAFFLFVIGKVYSKGSTNKAEALARVVGYVGAVIAVLSIEMASTGLLRAMYTGPLSGLFRIAGEIPSFGLWVEGVRMQSLMGLPNLYATFAAMCFFVSLWFLIGKPANEVKTLDIAVVSANGLGFFLAGSRGGLLGFGAAVFVLFVFGAKGKRLQALLKCLIIALWCFVAYLVIAVLMNGEALTVIPALLLSLYLPSFFWSPLSTATDKLTEREVKPRKILAICGGIIILAVVYVVMAMRFSEAIPLLPETFISRFRGIMTDINTLQRVEFWRDGLSLFTIRPIFGLGGGSVGALQHSVASSFYVSRHVHNHFLQVMVENGIVGLLIMLSCCVFVFLTLWRKREVAPTGFVPCAAAAISMMLIHSLVEASMHNTLNIAMFFLILGIISGVCGEDKVERNKSVRASRAVVCLCAALLIAVLGGRMVTQQYVRQAESRGTQAALRAYRMAVITDPLNATSYMSSTLMHYINNPDSGARLLSERFISDLERNTLTPQDCFVVARFHLRTGNGERAVWFFERVIELRRIDPNAWNEVFAQYLRALRDTQNYDEHGIRFYVLDSIERLMNKLDELNETLHNPITPSQSLMDALRGM